MKFRKRIVYIEAVQWWRHGDHPKVGRCGGRPGISQEQARRDGWLKTEEGGHVVHPGEWVICDERGRFTTCNAETFARLYEPAEPWIELSQARRLDESY